MSLESPSCETALESDAVLCNDQTMLTFLENILGPFDAMLWADFHLFASCLFESCILFLIQFWIALIY